MAQQQLSFIQPLHVLSNYQNYELLPTAMSARMYAKQKGEFLVNLACYVALVSMRAAVWVNAAIRAQAKLSVSYFTCFGGHGTYNSSVHA
jgi:hypothetical protein